MISLSTFCCFGAPVEWPRQIPTPRRLSDIALRDALKIADGIRGLVAKRRIIRKSTDEVIAAITISGGVALHRPGEPLNALIERSDAALYRAKDAGRNQVLPEAKLDPVIINR